MKKRFFALLLVAGLLSGCGRITTPDTTQPNTSQEVTVPAEEQINYDWMSGQSPVPNRRVGLNRGWDMSTTVQTVSDKGTYFIYNPGWQVDVTDPSPWILYMDHGSDTVIKLCGRPDCPHNTTDCNAFVDSAQAVHFYNGYLYVISSGPIMTEDNRGDAETYWVTKLWRMDPDGTNRVELFNFTDYVREKGADFAECHFLGSYCYFFAHVYETDPNTAVTTDTSAAYLYKLDGSMPEPLEGYLPLSPLYNCGDILLSLDDLGENKTYWDMDVDTGETTYLMDYPGAPAFCHEEQAFYFLDGCLHRFTYATGVDEVVVKTELTGTYRPLCFPDCFVLADSDYSREVPDPNLYIYNWAFESVGTLTVDFAYSSTTASLILSENPRQIILSGGTTGALPTYYIDKAELGTGNVTLHQLKMPDLEDDQKLQQENQEDQEWFDEN